MNFAIIFSDRILDKISYLCCTVSIGPVVFAQSSSSSTSPNSILDEYTYVCIKFNETIEEERGIPANINTDFLITQEICNMLLQGMGYLAKQEIVKKYE
jgi:hypothetical protein